jgi:hypothetical protein
MIPTSEWKTLDSPASREIWSKFDVALAVSAYKSRLTPPLDGWQIERNESLPLYVIADEDHAGARELLQIFEEHLAVHKDMAAASDLMDSTMVKYTGPRSDISPAG